MEGLWQIAKNVHTGSKIMMSTGIAQFALSAAPPVREAMWITHVPVIIPKGTMFREITVTVQDIV